MSTTSTATTWAFQVDKDLEARINNLKEEYKKAKNAASILGGMSVISILGMFALSYVHDKLHNTLLLGIAIPSAVAGLSGYWWKQKSANKIETCVSDLIRIPAAAQYGEHFDEKTARYQVENRYDNNLDPKIFKRIGDGRTKKYIISEDSANRQNLELTIECPGMGPLCEINYNWRHRLLKRNELYNITLQVDNAEKVMSITYNGEDKYDGASEDDYNDRTKETRIRKDVKTRQDLEAATKQKDRVGEMLRLLDKKAPAIYTLFLAMLPEGEAEPKD